MERRTQLQSAHLPIYPFTHSLFHAKRTQFKNLHASRHRKRYRFYPQFFTNIYLPKAAFPQKVAKKAIKKRKNTQFFHPIMSKRSADGVYPPGADKKTQRNAKKHALFAPIFTRLRQFLPA
jgi:hypothetical protein